MQTKNVGQMDIAIVGYGGMGSCHARQLKTMPDEVNLTGIYDILLARGKAAQQAGIRAYSSFEELLNDPAVKLVIVATPNDTHKQICIDLMRAGKNVICEKPVALSSLEFAEMVQASKENHVVFTVHQNRRWDEDFLTIKRIYSENMLGRVFNIESRVHGSRGIPGDWRNTKEHGGGMVLDWGVHLLDQILNMVDAKIVSVYAAFSYVTNEAVEDGFKIILQFENDLSCQVEVGTSNFINLPRWYIQGENGTAIIEDWNLNGKIIRVSDWENRDAVPVVTAAGLTKTMAPRTGDTIQEFPLPKVSSDVRDFYRNVIKACRGEEEILVKHSQIMRVMKLMEAIFKSAESNNVVFDI